MIFIPFRAKNPPERFPYVTIALIAINVLVYLLTSRYLLVVREDVVEAFAISHNTFSLLRMFTSMFLHGDLMHLLGNMLFLWIFGASAEGRLGPARFLAVYLTCGLAGDLADELVLGLVDPAQFSLGASGAIMGLAGASIYMFPFATICILTTGYRYRIRILEWQAQWVVLLYVANDIAAQLLYNGKDGIGHMAHLGGFGAGFLLVMALRAHRDSEYASEAQKMRAELKGDLNLLGYLELEALVEYPNDNVELIMAYLRKAVKQPSGSGYRMALETLTKHDRLLVEEADAAELALVALHIPESVGTLPLTFYLSLGLRVEKAGHDDTAAGCYQKAYQQARNAADAETALFRWGTLRERAGDLPEAAAVFTELLRAFPTGHTALQAKDALRRLGGPSPLVFSYGTVAPERSVTASVSGLAPMECTPAVGAPAESPARVGDTSGMEPLGGGRTLRMTPPSVGSLPAPSSGDGGDELRPVGSGR